MVEEVFSYGLELFSPHLRGAILRVRCLILSSHVVWKTEYGSVANIQKHYVHWMVDFLGMNVVVFSYILLPLLPTNLSVSMKIPASRRVLQPGWSQWKKEKFKVILLWLWECFDTMAPSWARDCNDWILIGGPSPPPFFFLSSSSKQFTTLEKVKEVNNVVQISDFSGSWEFNRPTIIGGNWPIQLVSLWFPEKLVW